MVLLAITGNLGQIADVKTRKEYSSDAGDEEDCY